MPEDASLDQFASPEATDSEDAETEDAETEDAETEDAGDDLEVETEASEANPEDTGTGPEDDAVSESPEESADLSTDADASTVEPAVSTYEWSSDGRECADCGASAGRLWRGEGQKDGGLVCADCKEW